MRTHTLFKSSILICLGLVPAYGTDYSSTASGNWDASIWTPTGTPLVGSTDNATIGAGHNVLWNNTSVGLAGTNDLGTSGGHTITINGGTLAQVPAGNWTRIGQGDSGTLNIKDGGFYFTSSTDTTGNSPTLQVGFAGGTGNVLIGDGTGIFSTAILNLRYLPDGFTENSIGAEMNIGSSSGGNGGGVGHVTIDADGELITDVRPVGGSIANQNGDPKVRIGQSATTLGQSTVVVKNGGSFTANGTVEVASNPPDGTARSNGALTLTGAQSIMTQSAGMLQVGLNGDAVMTVDDNAKYLKTDRPGDRQDFFLAQNTGSTGHLIIQNGGYVQFGVGNDVGDARFGYNGTGVVDINDGGTYLRESGNWEWIGQGATGNGTFNIHKGGLFRTTGGANVVIGNDAGSVGLILVDHGQVSLEEAFNGTVKVGMDGTGTYRQNGSDASTVAGAFVIGGYSGTGLVEMNGGTMSTRYQMFLGGDGGGAQGNGTGTYHQTDGDLTVNGSIVSGLAGNHTGIFTVDKGTVTHTSSDITIGENGTGTMTLATGTTFTDSSDAGTFMVGRNNGSSGTLIVNGALSRTTATAASSIRVGNGDQSGNPSSATGILGGTGTITVPAGTGVVIGSLGTLTGGTMGAAGTLTIQGDLSFVAGGTLNADFDATGHNDRINVNGVVNITGAKLTGTWAGGTSPTGSTSRYWLIVNDGTDPVTGTFANTVATSPNSSQAPGASAFITLGGEEFGIYYSANQATNALTGGNDVLLVAIGGGTTTPTSDQILKAVLGTNATTGGPNLPVVTRSGDNLVFTYNRIEASTTSYTATVEYSTTLLDGSWTTATAGMTAVTGTGDTRTVTVTIPSPAASVPKEFARLRITSN